MHDYCKYQQRLFALPTPMIAKAHPILASFYECTALIPTPRGWGYSFQGLKCRVEKLQRQGHYLAALNLLIEGLEQERFWVKASHKWWQLMLMAIHVIQERRPHTPTLFAESIQSLLKLCTNAPQPWQGHDVAYCFAQLSLWSFESGKLQMAIDQAKSAVFADPNWGYAEYLLGWYGLSLDGINPAYHFSRALKTSAGLFEHFVKDPLCLQFPHIFKETQQCQAIRC